MLATGLNGSQAAQTFMVNYTDGTSTVISQSLSDWFSPQSYPGESDAVTMTYRDTSNGGTDNRTFYLYGYAFPIDSTKTVKNVVLPNNRSVAVLSYTLGNPTINASPVSLASSFNKTAIYNDGATFSSTGGVDGVGDAYSAQLLGSSLEFNDVLYHFGNANAANDVSASGQTITLPSGQFSGLQFLAASMNGSQTSQTFTVTYTDGTKSTFTQSISDWFSPQSYAGELQAAKLPYRDTYSGGRDSRTFYLYNYKFSLNNTKTVKSIQLPNNANVQIMAMTVVQ